MAKCVICEHRPTQDGASGMCHNCAGKVNADKRRRGNGKHVKFLVYRGSVVGLYKTTEGMLHPELLRRDPKYLPKGRTLNLDTYLEGFTREQVKQMKKCVLHCANA